MSRVTITNPYDLLTDENEDRTNVPAPKKEQKPNAPKPAAKAAATGVAKPAAAKPKPAAPKPAEGAKAPAAAAPAKPAEAKAPAKAATGANANVVKPAPQRDSNQNLQEKDKESRPPRDKKDHRQPPAGGDKKRLNDRKSGTGRPINEVKKGGQGKANWGGEVDPKEGTEALKEKEEKTDDKEEVEENKEEKVTAEGEKKEGEAPKEGEAAKDDEDAKEVFTLDEYRAKLKAKAPPVEALKPRVVSQDQDFSGFVALQRDDDDVTPAKKDKKPAAEKAAAAGEKKENLASKLLKFASHDDKFKERGPYRRNDSFNGPRQGSDNKGPRKGSNSNNRGPRQGETKSAPVPDLQSSFPALGPHGSDAVKA